MWLPSFPLVTGSKNRDCGNNDLTQLPVGHDQLCKKHKKYNNKLKRIYPGRKNRKFGDNDHAHFSLPLYAPTMINYVHFIKNQNK